jgi:hypothetical protein
MNSGPEFREYLERVQDELLECLAADFAGLETLFRGEAPGREFIERREACRVECIRRRRPELYSRAEAILHPGLDSAA